MKTRLIALSIFALISYVQAFSQGITVSPTRLFFSGEAGSTQRQMVSITNAGKEPVSFNVGINDWHRDSVGGKVYLKAGTTSRSNATWIKPAENTITVPAGSTGQLEVVMQVPVNPPNDSVTNSMLMLTQIARQDDKFIKEKNVGLRILFEFALHVFYTPPGNNNQSLEFVGIDTIGASKDSGKRIAVRVKNTGNVISDASVEFEFINKMTGEGSKLSPIAISTMPGAVQLIYFDIPANLKGSYKGVSIIRIGDTSNVKVGEKNLDL